MDANDVLLVQDLLLSEGIAVCLLGEVVLSYYNVPRVIHDIELCIPEDLLEKAGEVLVTQLPDVVPYTYHQKEISPYNAHKVPYPRFSITTSNGEDFISLLPDRKFGLSPINDIITQSDVAEQAEYSNELSDFATKLSVLDGIHIPKLPALVTCFVKLHSSTVDFHRWVYAANAEQLVDGMDLNETWCNSHLTTLDLTERQFFLGLVETKPSRVSQFYPDWITGFIPTREEASRIRRIPGRGQDSNLPPVPAAALGGQSKWHSAIDRLLANVQYYSTTLSPGGKTSLTVAASTLAIFLCVYTVIWPNARRLSKLYGRG